MTMLLSALLTSTGINVALCALMLSLYSFLRKQPENASVYFGRRKLKDHAGPSIDGGFVDRFVPSPKWILKAWELTDDDILAIAGLDAVVLNRSLVFSMRIFSIAAAVCIIVILPLNYSGKEIRHPEIHSESLDVFTIGNVEKGSRRLWVHCLALYIITFSACILLYLEYKSIARRRLVYITRGPTNCGPFTIIVRAIPKSTEESFSDSVRKIFKEYYASSYLSHQMIYKVGKVHKVMNSTENVFKKLIITRAIAFNQKYELTKYRCGLCGEASDTPESYSNGHEISTKNSNLDQSNSDGNEEECSAAFVFFKTRYAAVVASQVLQSSDPVSWVTDLAPEPRDVYWSNLWIPYKQLWLRRIATLLASIGFMVLFVLPVTFVQGLTQLGTLKQKLPFLNGILKQRFVIQIVTGFLPSVILMLFLSVVPPMMMLFSAVEGPISRSGRKNSACFKILFFNIWNIFFINVLSGTLLHRLNVFSNPMLISSQLSGAVPGQATFFITYILSSGWASISSELMQLFPLLWNFMRRYIFRNNTKDYVPSFPYHTEVPRILVFGLLGFTCSVLAPLILPFLLVFFFLGYVVYRNQILNVYCPRYESGGQLWPYVHNTTIFSLVLAQIIALGVFGLKKAPVVSGFVIPLVICTLLFNEYCRRRFQPIFNNFPAQDIMEMDQEDEQSGKMKQTHELLLSAYRQFPSDPLHESKDKEDKENKELGERDLKDGSKELEDGLGDPALPDLMHPTLMGLPVSKSQDTITSLTTLVSYSDRNSPKRDAGMSTL